MEKTGEMVPEVSKCDRCTRPAKFFTEHMAFCSECFREDLDMRELLYKNASAVETYPKHMLNEQQEVKSTCKCSTKRL